jgi:hypothetical protein
MSTPAEKLAQALETLKRIQDTGRCAIQSQDLTRPHREALLRNGFLQKVIKGWYIPSRPEEHPGDTTPWYSAFWEFSADYANDRFGDQWCLSPEQSILLHVGSRTVPNQLLIRAPKGGNKPIDLIHGTSIFDYRGSIPKPQAIVTQDRLNIYDLPNALVDANAIFFARNQTDARAALAAIPSGSALLPRLLDGGHSTIAGRLCGAFRNIGRDEVADEIKKTMKSVGYEVPETDPFQEKITWDNQQRTDSPRAARLRLMWQTMREEIVGKFPQAPKKYLQQVEDAYVRDAYHSLSIEGYCVSPELIGKVRSGQWNPDTSEEDRKQYDALAARGYYQAFESVKKSLKRVLDGDNAGELASQDHSDWYRELFIPLVNAGAQNSGSLAGYRSGRVLIKGSRHIPAAGDSIADLMTVFFELLELEEDPATRIVLGHFIFVYIHPFSDGNGRTARFLMNLMLASGGYPWTIIPVSQRAQYMRALESASVDQDIKPFAQFLSRITQSQLDGEQLAKLPETKEE